MICRTCGEDKPRIKTNKKHGIKRPKYVYIDLSGGIWSKRQCPSCFKARRVCLSRKSGVHRDRDNQIDLRLVKGYESEMIAKAALENMDIYKKVEFGAGKGPDLIARLGHVNILFEVKTVCVDRRTKVKYVNRVGPGAKHCDFIICVYPDKSLMIDIMEDHLKVCGKNGSRYRGV